MKNILLCFSLLAGGIFPALGAETGNLWTTGKIHVVISVMLTILILIFVFLFVLERKISRMEANQKKS